MRKRIERTKVVAVIAVAAALVFTTSAGAHGYFHECAGPGEAETNLLEHGTTCSQAQKVARKVYVKSQTAPAGNRLHAIGWTCTLAHAAGTPSSPERPITCRRGTKVIKAPLPG